MSRFTIALFLTMIWAFPTFAQTSVQLAPSNKVQDAPVCGVRFLHDFKTHYGLFACITRGDKLCISERINEKSTTAFASMAGATGAGVAKIVNSKVLSQFARQGAQKVASKVAWAAVAGGVYFIGTKVVGGVVGFLADTSDAGECRDNHPWVLYVKGPRRCEIGYKITDNPVAANFFNLDNEAMQLDLLRDPQICSYFYNLHLLVKAHGETLAAKEGLEPVGLFKDSPGPETTVLPKGPRLKIKTPETTGGGTR